MPQLAQAIERHELGFEAARVVARVATAHTVDEWVTRARERTVRQLRDEADAAEMVSRLTEQTAIVPPSESLMKELEGIESAIVSGAAFAKQTAGEADHGQMSADGEGASADEDEGQMSAAGTGAADDEDESQMSSRGRRRRIHRHRALGRVTLRLRVRAETRAFYRWLERLFLRHRPVQVPFPPVPLSRLDRDVEEQSWVRCSVRLDLRARPVSVPESGLHPPRCDSSSFEIPVRRRR